MCRETATKTVIKNHVMKKHNSGDEKCYLIKAEGAYDKDYWLFFSVTTNTTLTAIDHFLREIWCECCGHLSAFYKGGDELDEDTEIAALNIGDKLVYEYDFGTTTEVNLTIISEILRPKNDEEIVLLVRNEPITHLCDSCGAIATYVNVWEEGFLCENCAEDKEALMPITNSPRMGECGYTGEEDRWVFDKSKPFPQN